MTRPANLPHGRWLGDFPDLGDAEEKLIAACAHGEWCRLGSEVPEKPTDANRIRAELIRFLLLGGDDKHPVHEAGVQVRGGWIEGDVGLEMVHATGPLYLFKCRLGNMTAWGAYFPGLMLRGSQLASLSVDRMEVEGTVFLDGGFTANGEVRLLGARIKGNLDCSGGSFRNAGEDGTPNGDALSFDGAVINGYVYLSDGFSAIGQVRLTGVEIGRYLVCDGGTFRNAGKDGIPKGYALHADRAVIKSSAFLRNGFSAIGEVRLLGAQIGGNLVCSRGSFWNDSTIDAGCALSGDGLNVADSLFLRKGEFSGRIDLTSASVGSLIDDANCWPAGKLILDGFSYDRIAGPTGAKERIAWLKRQNPEHLAGDFRPQPWEQLIKVLREMGHSHAASRVAIEKQRVWRKSRPHRWRQPSWWVHKAYGIFAGYGYRPWWTVGWMFAFCCLSALFYYDGREAGLFGPSNPIILAEPALANCGAESGKHQAPWTSPACPMPPEYSTFQPFLYSLDVILPVIDLHQEHDWSPIVATEAGETIWGGRILRWILWLEILIGWAGSLLLAAVAGNLVKKD